MATKNAASPRDAKTYDPTTLTDEQKELIAGSQHIQDLIREVDRLHKEHDAIEAEHDKAEAELEAAIAATTAANAPPPPPPPEGGATRSKTEKNAQA